MRIAVVDCETNGTEFWRHSLWEFGAVMVSPPVHPYGYPEEAAHWEFQVPADLLRASPDALRVNRYFERGGQQEVVGASKAAYDMASKLSGLVVASCNVSFDVSFMTSFLLANGLVPTWRYSPIDIKSLCYGRRPSLLGASTGELLKAFKIDADEVLAREGLVGRGRHSALADAYLAAELLRAAQGWPSW